MNNNTPPPFTPENTTSFEGYFVKLFGEVLGPFTQQEVQQGVEAGEFPADSTVALSASGEWHPIQDFRKLVQPGLKQVPPAFRAPGAPPPFKGVIPPPFKKPQSDAA